MSVVEDLLKTWNSRFGLYFDMRRMLCLGAHYLLHVSLCFRHSFLKSMKNLWVNAAVISPAKCVQAVSSYKATVYSDGG
jgi:hypothetical protein